MEGISPLPSLPPPSYSVPVYLTAGVGPVGRYRGEHTLPHYDHTLPHSPPAPEESTAVQPPSRTGVDAVLSGSGMNVLVA